MNSTEILKRCASLPSITARLEQEGGELLLSGSEGNGRICMTTVFPGIMLALISIHAPSWPALLPAQAVPDERGPLILNYCMRGSCGLVLNDRESVFLTSGQIAITEKIARSRYNYPGGVYEGIEILIDQERASGGAALLSDSFGLDSAELKRRYCPDGETFLAAMRLPDSIRERLCSDSEQKSIPDAVGRKTGVIDLIALLLSGQAIPEAEQTYYTRSQVRLAKQIEAIIVGDLSQQHTVHELAARFSVSEGSMKNYFRGVFGQSIPQYRRYRRMLYAAELLTETSLPVIEVAGKVGYESQSKFSAAFRRSFGTSPLEYRRSRRIPEREP